MALVKGAARENGHGLLYVDGDGLAVTGKIEKVVASEHLLLSIGITVGEV